MKIKIISRLLYIKERGRKDDILNTGISATTQPSFITDFFNFMCICMSQIMY